MRHHVLALVSFVAAFALADPAAAQRRALTSEDINALHTISNPQVSADGEWVAYEVRTADMAKDKRVTHIWMASWDGKRQVQLTYSPESEHTPRWSPDGKYLAFLTARGGDEDPEQVWLLDRLGGEAKPLTGFNGDVTDYAWSPDSKRLALVVADEDPNRKKKGEEDKTAPPIVIDRYYFKEDETGYLTALRQHLYVFDVETRKAEILTPGKFDEGWPAWSPDGSTLAFLSKRGPDPDRTDEYGLYVMAPKAGAEPRLVTKFQGGDWMASPAWHPNGRELAFVTAGDPKLIYYSTQNLAMVPVAGGEARILTRELDRNVIEPRWSRNGRSIYFLLEDDRNQHLAKIDVASGKIERLVAGRRETTKFDVGGNDRIAVIDGTVHSPESVHALDGRELRKLAHHNDAFMGGVKLGQVEEISFPSADGTRISGLIALPPDYVQGTRYPTLLWIHGGPVSQFANGFEMP